MTHDIEIHWFAFCVAFTVIATAVFLGCFFLGAHLARDVIGLNGWSFQ